MMVGAPKGWAFLDTHEPTIWYVLVGLGLVAAVIGALGAGRSWVDRAADLERPTPVSNLLGAAGRALVFVFRVPGINAIALYFGNEFVFKAIVTKWPVRVFDPDAPFINAWYAWLRGATGLTLGSWLFALSWLALWWLICYRLYRKNVFIKV
jgi:hypothetical protein